MIRAILSVAAVLAVAACAMPGHYNETHTTRMGGVTQHTSVDKDYVPAWARPGADHSNADSRAP